MADPGEGPGRPAPPLIFRPKWDSKGRKKMFWEHLPPLSWGLDDPLRPPPPPYLKVWILHRLYIVILGSLSKDVFEGRTSTGSEPFSLFICLDANKFVLLSFFSLMKRIYPRVSNKSLPNDAKGPLPVDVRRSTTLLLKLPIKRQTMC